MLKEDLDLEIGGRHSPEVWTLNFSLIFCSQDTLDCLMFMTLSFFMEIHTFILAFTNACVEPYSSYLVNLVIFINISKYFDHAIFHVVLWCFFCSMLVIVFCIVYLGSLLKYKVLAIILACLSLVCLLCSLALYTWVYCSCIWSLHSVQIANMCLVLCSFALYAWVHCSCIWSLHSV